MHHRVKKYLLCAATVFTATIHAAPILTPFAPYARIADFQVNDNTYPHFGLMVHSFGNFPTAWALPFTAPLDPHMGYPQLTIWGPWVFALNIGFQEKSHLFSTNEQFVEISGMVQHRDGGQVFNFDLLSRPESDPSICQRGGPYGHHSGYDTFSACLNVQRSVSGGGVQVLSWNASIDAWHHPVPEPSQLSLMLLASTIGALHVAAHRAFRRDDHRQSLRIKPAMRSIKP
jgi:hypothetical protein